MEQEDLYYHYCSVSSFFKIITNKTLWLSDADYMNDHAELKWIDTVMNKILKEKNNQLKKEYDRLEHKKHYFISFSKEKDILSQWRCYADDGQGVAIGFNFSKAGIYSRSSFVVDENSLTSKIGYEDIRYDERIEASIRDIVSSEGVNSSALFIKELATMIKHPSFQEEKEVRLIYTPENTNQSIEKNKYIDYPLKNISGPSFRESNHQIIPYYEYKFDCQNNSSIISEVVLGPKCKLKEKDLKKFLEANKFLKTDIISSKSTYR